MATNINTILSWFKTGLKPTQDQFWASWTSFWHKDEKIPQSSISELETVLNAKAEKEQLEAHFTDPNAHTDQFLTKEDKVQKGIAGGYAPLDEFTKLASQYLNIIDDLYTGGSTSILSAQQGVVLQSQIDGINTLLSSDNINLDTIQEIVDAIENVESYLATILVNDLTTGGVTKALTAEMGKQLNLIKLTATLATDAETQITAIVPEDSKVVSRLKLFNWWEWVKTKSITLTSNLTMKGGSIGIIPSSGSYPFFSITYDSLMNYSDATNYMQWGYQKLAWYANGFRTELFASTPTQVNNLNLPNKSGILAIINDFVTTAAGTTTTPSLIIPSGVLTTSPQNGAIERDANGFLWETHAGVRSRLITTSDGLILIAYKSPTLIQTNISGAISATAQSVSSNTVIGNIGNVSVLRLNAVNEVYFLNNNPSGGPTAPTLAKTEIFLKINNGLFALDYTGSSGVSQVKIMEYSGLSNNGFKNYQNSFLTNIQNHNPLVAQWSTLQLIVQTINDGVITNADATYYLRDTANSRTFGAAEASFSFVFKNTVTYADGTNTGGQNTSKVIRLNNHALFLETIR